MAKNNLTVREPLFHVVKRDGVSKTKSWAIRIIAILLALVFSGIITMLLTGENPISVYATMFEGAFGSSRKVWKLLQNLAMLLCVSLALTPAFKMRFWNIGGEGQVLIGGLATTACMVLLGNKVPNALLIIIMIVASVVAGALWALIPKGAGKIGIINRETEAGWLPVIGDKTYLLNILIVLAITIAMYIYLKYSKHGYEISVVGESENTARYIGINVKKVILRTMALSGAVCGIAGLLLVGGTDHTISTTTADGRGFTAIMVSWLAKFNPIYMVLTSLLLVFLEAGADQISMIFGLNQSFSEIITGIILFFIIGSEFFINYKLQFRTSSKKEVK